MRKYALIAAKAAVSIGLLYFALARTDFSAVSERLSRLDMTWGLLAVAVLGVQIVLISIRWRKIAESCRAGLSLGRACHLNLIATFFNQVLPSTVGGDAYRAWGAYRRGVPGADAVASVLVDRIFALVSLVIMIVLGLWWLLDIIQAPAARWIVAVVVFGAFAGFAALIALVSARQWLQRWPATRMLLTTATKCWCR